VSIETTLIPMEVYSIHEIEELLYLFMDVRKFYTFLSWNNYFKLRGCLGGLLSKWLHL